MLFTKSIHKPVSLEDGVRLSVMSRHTLNDGKIDDPLITEQSYDYWYKSLAPPESLVGDYYKRKMPFEEFSFRYRSYLSRPDVSRLVKYLAKWAVYDDITLLCVEDSAEKCHRKILAEECLKYRPNILIEHR